jgi:hypothetical protein
VSLYFGLAAAALLLDVSSLSLVFRNNKFASCAVSVSVSGGNAYGGAASVYIGAYMSVFASNVAAAAAAGDTVVRNVSVSLDSSRFDSCSAVSFGSFGANVYGGSFSFYIGAYAWSRSASNGTSSSSCGTTRVSGVIARIFNTTSNDISASTTVRSASSRGANSYGGSLSVLYIGAYSWSFSGATSSSSRSSCGATSAGEVSVTVTDSACSNCSAMSTNSGGNLFGASSYGGSMSVLYVGSYAWSFSASAASSSTCGLTNASSVTIRASGLVCYNCSAVSHNSRSSTRGANSYGGSVSGLHVGAYAWSFSSGDSSSSSSICGETSVISASVHVHDSVCSNCVAHTSTTPSLGFSFGTNSYGGSMSVLHAGAYSFSFSSGVFSSSICRTTNVSLVSIHVTGSTCNNCSSSSTNIRGDSYGANTYGGYIAAHIGAYAYSYALGAFLASSTVDYVSLANTQATLVNQFSIAITNSTITDSTALSRE